MNIIKECIFPDNNLDFEKISNVIAESSGPSIDLSDLYMQYTTVESWTCEDGIVKSGSQDIDSGYGIRSISNEKTGFAYGNNFSFSEIIKSAQLSRSIVASNKSKSINLKENSNYKKLYISESPLTSITDEDKVNCSQVMQAYLGGRVRDPIVAGILYLRSFTRSLRSLRPEIIMFTVNLECNSNSVA